MGSIVTALTGGGGAGLAYKPQAANVVTPVNQQQATDAYNQAQGALTQQQQFAQAVAAQNGLGNQTNVYNQLQGVANGTGPNPAQAQLAQATGANVSNQAALMAGQRGANANAGLIARQAAMQGANTQQQAAGQGATLQAQQSLNAIGQAGNMANQQAQQQAAATNAYTGATQAEQQNLLNSIAQSNNANVGMQSNINSVQGGLAQQTAGMQGNLLGNLAGAAGTAFGGPLGGFASSLFTNAATTPTNQDAASYNALPNAPMQAEGGEIKAAYASGGQVGPRSKVGQHMSGGVMPGMPIAAMAEGGRVPALVSPGEKYLSPNAVKQVEQGKNPMQVGEKIPGKPVVKGAKNSYANDIVPKTLEEGGIVIPRSVTQSKDAEKKAHAFVSAILAKHGKSLPKKG